MPLVLMQHTVLLTLRKTFFGDEMHRKMEFYYFKSGLPNNLWNDISDMESLWQSKSTSN